MKIIFAILGIIIIAAALLVFLFVRWANQPENVEALKKRRETEASKKIEDEKNRAALESEIEAKKANLKLVIDENFEDGKFNFLDYKFDQSSRFKFAEKQFVYDVSAYKDSNTAYDFIFSKEDFGDFAAEMNFKIWGRDAQAGIFWNTQPNGEKNPTEFQAALSTPNSLDVNAGDSESYPLGDFLESATTQKLRVERFGKNIKVSVNDKVLFDKTIENSAPGKVGICIGYRGIRQDRESINIEVKDFRVWK